MAFVNRIRLPFYLTQPTFPLQQEVFRLANGTLKNQYSIVRKVWKAKTDYMPKLWHESLRVALAHDHITIESREFNGGVALEGAAYDIDWNDYMDYPVAPATFQVQVDGLDLSNSNCMTCEQAGQLDLTDDNLGEIVEGGAGAGNVFSNDSIFCDPVTAAIVTYDTIYLSAAPTISDAGAVAFILNSPLPNVTSAKIFTYRVTCPDGSYDDADVYINIDGSLEGCSMPDNVRGDGDPAYNAHSVIWDGNGSPDDGYYWELFRRDNLGATVATGTTASTGVDLTELESCTEYVIFVRAVCETGVVESQYNQYLFDTECQEASCGRYEVGYDNGSPERTQGTITYLDCASQYRTRNITNTQVVLICMLQTEPGSPSDAYGSYTSINYQGECG